MVPRFLRGGANPKWVRQPIIRPNFPENCMEIKKIGPSALSWGVSRICLYRSATGFCTQIKLHVFIRFKEVEADERIVCILCLLQHIILLIIIAVIRCTRYIYNAIKTRPEYYTYLFAANESNQFIVVYTINYPT